MGGGNLLPPLFDLDLLMETNWVDCALVLVLNKFIVSFVDETEEIGPDIGSAWGVAEGMISDVVGVDLPLEEVFI